MNKVETYALGLLAEECGEVVQLVGKSIRFGIDTPEFPYQTHSSARNKLQVELGDVVASIQYAHVRGVVDGHKVNAYAKQKLDKLLNANSKDNLGRRLAP